MVKKIFGVLKKTGMSVQWEKYIQTYMYLSFGIGLYIGHMKTIQKF